MTGGFGSYDFGLTPDAEARAQRLHAESLIIDILFQGPCGYRSFSTEHRDEIEKAWAGTDDLSAGLVLSGRVNLDRLLSGQWPESRQVWEASGITAGNRQFTMRPRDLAGSFAGAVAQFDRLTWLSKAICGDDFRRAQAEGKRAGFLTTQDTTGIDRELSPLDLVHQLGGRVIGLTYNQMNYVGSGCTDRADGGVSDFGARFIRRMNELGIIADTAHSGRQTTLDACSISSRPVIASHTSADAVSPHDRAKSDSELRALAGTGGVIGVVAVPFFLSTGRDVTIDAMLDHIDYVANLVGWQHVAIGTDWPLQMTRGALSRIGEMEGQYGFRPEHRVSWTTNLIGFDDYRDFPNITRGLVKRGYTDEQVQAILGENFLRVVDDVCGKEAAIE